MIEDEKLNEYVIPENYSMGFSLFGRPVQNLVEAVVMTFIVFRIIMEIPFLFKIKICVLLFFCMSAFMLGLIGIKGESVGTFLVGYIKYIFKRRVYVFRNPEKSYQVLKENKATTKQKEAYTSYYERTKKKLREKFSQI